MRGAYPGAMVEAIGEAWSSNGLAVYQEHAATRVLQEELLLWSRERQPRPVSRSKQRVVLATPSGERHEQPLMLLQTMLTDRGVQSIHLGAELPATELAKAATRYQVNTVALSMTVLSTRLATQYLEVLDRQLEQDVTVWVGGMSCRQLINLPERVRVLLKLSDVFPLLDQQTGPALADSGS